MTSIEGFLQSEDPLSQKAAEYLLAYSEEDNKVDYKKTINITQDKSWLADKAWLEMTKDISAFANTFGGYLVCGITDKNKKIVGLDQEVINTLKDANNLRQKINSYLEPDISLIRSKEFKFNDKAIVIIYIPQSINKTHLVKKIGSFKFPSGETKIVLRKGTFYVRRSAGNHLGDSQDLEDLIERRINQFRESLMDKVARVVASPVDSNMYILTKDPSAHDGERFIIEDKPESIVIKGMSFTVPPEGKEEEISAWTALSKGKSKIRPPSTEIWKWYADRETTEIRKRHKLAVFRFSLWNNSPPFYWIKDLNSEDIREALFEAIRNRPPGCNVSQMLKVAAFLGKGTYNQALSKLGDYITRINPRFQKYPDRGPRKEFGEIKKPMKLTINEFKEIQLKKLNSIASDASKKGKTPSSQSQWTANNIDCFLYARDDKYK